MLFGFGGLIMHYNDSSAKVVAIKNKSEFIVYISEPLSEKASSWKTVGKSDHPEANILLYFRKDSLLKLPVYGSRIGFIKQPEEIKNIPAFKEFDYKKYCALKNIYYQVFLKPGEFIVLPGNRINRLDDFLFRVQKWVVNIIQKYIPGKKESGLAEALLIGYKDDLDKALLQSYSNTGVVHVIAISGLHLGLIYGLLKYICVPFSRKRWGSFIKPVIIISGLWLFSLLAGGSPSVLRSTVMFTFIVVGECISKRSYIYNSLAASAFFLLCYDPHWLWDIGFQLSYFALTSIVIFMKPVYHLIITKNKIIDAVWKLNAVTIAAQILTTPVCIFYFRQFPNLFLITNFIAVPASSFILGGEILLCLVSFLPEVSIPLGRALALAIRFMNSSIEWLGSFPFSATTGIELSFIQLLIIYIILLYLAGKFIDRG